MPDDKAHTMPWDVFERAFLLAGLNQMARDMTHWRQVADSPDIAELHECLHRLVARKERVRTPAARRRQSVTTSLRSSAAGPVKNQATAARGKSSNGGTTRRSMPPAFTAAWVDCLHVSGNSRVWKPCVRTLGSHCRLWGPSSPLPRLHGGRRTVLKKKCGDRASLTRSSSNSSTPTGKESKQSCCVTQNEAT